jgi:hypothetical protein
MRFRALIALALLSACATSDPFADLAGAQRRLDDRGIGFGVTRVPGHDAFVFQLRFVTSGADSELNTDINAAVQAAAPPGCTVSSVDEQSDESYVAQYDC